REIRQSGKYYELNGRRVNFRGDNLQVANNDRIDYGGKVDAIDTFPGFLPPSENNPGWPKAVDNFLRLNFNVQREHMGPWTPYMIDICDEMGLMLIGESAARLNNFDRVNGRAQHEAKCLGDIVKRDKNHPSIIRWSSVNEPECDDPTYHLELYEGIKSIDDTRPISEDIWSIDYLKSRVDEVFRLLLDKDDFSWMEHYISFDEAGKVVHICSQYNDAVIPLPDRPFGLGEADWNAMSAPSEFTCFATTIAMVRAQDASDVRPYVLLSGWSSSVPGVRTQDFIGEDGKNPVYGEDNLPDPWTHPGINLIQKACNPLFAFDYEYWKINRKSNAAGSFPVITPQIRVNSQVTREIVVFNDEFSGNEVELYWNVKLGSVSNRIYDEGVITLDIGSGFMGKVVITFKTPEIRNILILTLVMKKNGVERFKDDTTCFEVMNEKDYSMQEFLTKLGQQ
ncbi:MAG: glycoside hydrolase family 2 TIM barrel-domain containing protein, partial [Clostridiales bacterium]|nr:glycoside hydrolase family 2 TIM barrel-domain containing protein [Clostridiales bacterium]